MAELDDAGDGSDSWPLNAKFYQLRNCRSFWIDTEFENVVFIFYCVASDDAVNVKQRILLACFE